MVLVHNPDNERVKRRYFIFLKEAERHSEATVDAAAMALSRFEADTKWRDFRTFHHEQAVAFKRRLASQDGRVPGTKLSKATLHATMSHLKRFFQWLAHQPGYRSRVNYTHAEYFNLSDKDTRIATARREPRVPTIEQLRHVIAHMPATTEIEQRDRALVALVLLTGIRDRALASLKLKHIDPATSTVYQDARDVQTKNSKTFETFFFPVGADLEQIVADWVTHLKVVKLWGNDDPLFPATAVKPGPSRRFVAIGLSRQHWSTAAPIRTIFRSAFESAGLPYFNPHSVRNTLTELGERLCQSPEEYKAWSQNFGHESPLTTFTNYGQVPRRRQAEIIRELGTRDAEGGLPRSRIERELAQLRASLEERLPRIESLSDVGRPARDDAERSLA
jgi:integrase